MRSLFFCPNSAISRTYVAANGSPCRKQDLAVGQTWRSAAKRNMTANPNQQKQYAAASPVVEPFITKPEVARRLNKKLRTVDNWMKLGLLPYYKIGRSVAFKWGEIETALARTCRVAR